MEINVGTRLKQLRKERKISIAKLSELSGVSTGMISQIEREITAPSIVNLWRLAQALNSDINYFFEKNEIYKKTVIRSGSHKILVTDDENANYKLLGPTNMKRELDLIEVTLQPGNCMEIDPISHDGEECGYVLEGTLTLYLDGEYITLEKGDSIHILSTQPHKYLNRSESVCVSVWAMTPSFF